MTAYAFYYVIVSLCVYIVNASGKLGNNTSVRFLVTVNDTWQDPPGCIKTVLTPDIKPNGKKGHSEKIIVGACDEGPLEYTIISPGKENCKYTVSLIFQSSVIEDASPPACDISWNGTYLVPVNKNSSGWDVNNDVLPGCFVMDSREGYHMTYYWFHLLDWKFE